VVPGASFGLFFLLIRNAGRSGELWPVAAARTGELAVGLAVALTSLSPRVTVLLARVVLGERLRWVQRAGLGLAAIGILLVAT
jgi:drug/metabolite transporter (DMT)-like permease